MPVVLILDRITIELHSKEGVRATEQSLLNKLDAISGGLIAGAARSTSIFMRIYAV